MAMQRKVGRSVAMQAVVAGTFTAAAAHVLIGKPADIDQRKGLKATVSGVLPRVDANGVVISTMTGPSSANAAAANQSTPKPVRTPILCALLLCRVPCSAAPACPLAGWPEC
jgi:hypothetical protein